MKRIPFILLLTALAFAMTACGKVSAEPVTAQDEPEDAPIIIEADSGSTASDSEQAQADASDAVQVDYSDPMSMVSTLLNDPGVLGGESTEAMTDNMGGQFGSIDVKEPGDDGSCFQFGAGDDGAWMQLNTRLGDLGNRDNAQAILIKFRPNDTTGLSFNLEGNGEVALTFEDNLPYFSHANDNYSAPYSDYLQTGLTLQSDGWYWALMAFDSNGYYRSLVWEDGNGQNCAYCGENIGDWHGDYRDSDWQFVIGFGANQTLSVQEYYIMDFDSLAQDNIWSGTQGNGEQTQNQDNDGQSDDQGGYQDPIEMVCDVVSDPQVLYQDDLGSLPEHGYTAYSDVDEKNIGDGFEFITYDGSNGFTFLTPLLDVVPEDERRDNMSQAVLLCFKTTNPEGLQFNLTAEETAFVSFADGGEPAFGIEEQAVLDTMPFGEQTPTGFTLEANKWYYAFVAIDAESNFRCKVWEFGNPDNYTYCQTKLTAYVSGDEERQKFREKDWTFGVQIGYNSRFNLQEFKVLDFAEITGVE